MGHAPAQGSFEPRPKPLLGYLRVETSRDLLSVYAGSCALDGRSPRLDTSDAGDRVDPHGCCLTPVGAINGSLP